jgi:hypothetical protein
LKKSAQHKGAYLLRWITDRDEHIFAVYFNPHDPDLGPVLMISALAFRPGCF